MNVFHTFPLYHSGAAVFLRRDGDTDDGDYVQFDNDEHSFWSHFNAGWNDAGIVRLCGSYIVIKNNGNNSNFRVEFADNTAASNAFESLRV